MSRRIRSIKRALATLAGAVVVALTIASAPALAWDSHRHSRAFLYFNFGYPFGYYGPYPYAPIYVYPRYYWYPRYYRHPHYYGSYRPYPRYCVCPPYPYYVYPPY